MGLIIRDGDVWEFSCTDMYDLHKQGLIEVNVDSVIIYTSKGNISITYCPFCGKEIQYDPEVYDE